MSQQPNPTLIGAFVLGSIVLVVGGLVTFGGGRFFTERVTYVGYFGESVSGLSTGAPVNFRGVKVGEVGDIEVHVDSNDTVSIPVYLILQRRRIREADGASGEGDLIEKLIDRGMRAQLQLQSIVTGQLQVHLDLHPGATLERRDVTTDFPEMPTVPSNFAELTERIESLSLEDLVTSAQQMILSLNRLLESPDLEGVLKGLNHGIRDMQKMIAATQKEIDHMASRFETTLDEADTTLESVRATMATARTALDSASESLAIASEDSPLRYELQEALSEMTAAAKAVRVLAEYLERNPDALLRGKSE